MTDNTAYEVLVDELTVHKQIAELTDPITGRVIGIQQGGGKTYFKGEVVPADAVSPFLVEALEDKNHPSYESVSRKLKASSGDSSENTALRLGLPFEGYEDMDEDAILASMVVLPSPTIQRIKEYERVNSARSRIMDYNIGFGESPEDRALGIVGSPLDVSNRDDSDKAVARLTTREVPKSGVVQQGEGITGIGVPDKPYGETKEAEEADDDDAPRPNARKGRRPRGQAGAKKSDTQDDKSSE